MSSSVSPVPVEESAADVRAVVGPEGVPIPFRLASLGGRLIALVVDIALLAVLLTVVLALGFTIGGESFMIPALVLFFVARNFWFTGFELARGRTPGKHLMGLQVVDRHGGPLEADAVFVRNVMREIELFTPLGLLVQAGVQGNGLVAAGSLLWALIVASLPLFNRDRLRPGDLVAGTLVVCRPSVEFDRDLGVETAAHTGFRFRADMLDSYGVKELHVLEGLLRHARPDRRTLRKVGRTIRRRIAWQGGDPTDERAFLEAFYKAQRGHLEQRLLLGDAPADKHAARDED